MSHAILTRPIDEFFAMKKKRTSRAARARSTQRGGPQRGGSVSAAATSDAGPRRPRRELRIGRLVAVGGLIAVCLVIGLVFWRGPSVESLIDEGRAALERREFPVAAELAAAALERAPESNDALLLAGHVAAAEGEFPKCLQYLERIPDDGSRAAVDARCFAGDVLLLHFKRLSAAETQYRRALSQDAENLSAHDHLAFALGVSARPWEQIRHRLALIEGNRFAPAHLQSLSLGDYAIENDNLVQEYLQGDDTDAAPRLMLARLATEEQDYPRAERLLRSVVEDDPALLEGYVKLGHVLLMQGDMEGLRQWEAGLPPGAEKVPGIWVVRGQRARRLNAPAAAARCFWETVKLNPEHEQANYQLGQQLVALSRPEDAEPFLERAALLQEYVNVVKVTIEAGQPEMLRRSAELAEELGLVWEAYAWLSLLMGQQSHDEAILAKCDQLRMQFTGHRQSRSLAAVNPARRLDLSDIPLLDAGVASGAVGSLETRGVNPTVSLRNDAPRAGLKFQYINGGDPLNSGIGRMYEFSGGGIGVVDYDNDGWPDLCMTQGGPWEHREHQSEHLDGLFRNLGKGQWEEIGGKAGVDGSGFGQGVTVGDFDNDGFADLFVANIGANRFYRNNGDGTFADITEQTGTAGTRWTSSCVLADFTGDGLPELYAVNYLTGERIFEYECRSGGQESGGRGACFPQYFPAAQDQLYWNQGDGTFHDVTQTSGIRLPHGKGLGIAAFDMDGGGKLSLFVANDSTTNFLLLNQTVPGSGPSFIEEAMLRGVAMNDAGKSEACMGVAVGDADNDGHYDLFVTNFFKESNTLYQHLGDGQFVDQTRSSRLLDPSLRQLGFGTQFVDLDLDGAEDLFVANGHIGDYRREGTPYQMRPQLFQNGGDGVFAEVDGQSAGEYFQGQFLGRAAARIDWNRDGRDDLVVGHLDAPVALLTNTTAPCGNWLAIQLRGTDAARDAIGTTVEVSLADRTLVRQLVAGDGYQASNQRCLRFGLGSAEHIDAVTVRWPGGEPERFTDIAINSELIISQGRGRPIPLNAVNR